MKTLIIILIYALKTQMAHCDLDMLHSFASENFLMSHPYDPTHETHDFVCKDGYSLKDPSREISVKFSCDPDSNWMVRDVPYYHKKTANINNLKKKGIFMCYKIDTCPLVIVDRKVVELNGKYRQNLELEQKDGRVSFSCASIPGVKIDLECNKGNILEIVDQYTGERKPYSNYLARRKCLGPCEYQLLFNHYVHIKKYFSKSSVYTLPDYRTDITEVQHDENIKLKCKNGFMSHSRGKKIKFQCRDANLYPGRNVKYFGEDNALLICRKYCKGKSSKNAGIFELYPTLKRFAVGESATLSCFNVDYQDSEASLVCTSKGWSNKEFNMPVVNMASPCEFCNEAELKSYPGFDKLEMGPRYVRNSESYFLSQCKNDKFLKNFNSAKYIFFKCNLIKGSWSYGIVHEGTIHYKTLGNDKNLLKCSKLAGECDLSGKISKHLDWNNLKKAKNGTSFKCFDSDVRISVVCDPDGTLKFTHYPSLEPTDLGDDNLEEACKQS